MSCVRPTPLEVGPWLAWKAAEGAPYVIAAYAVAGDLDAVLHVRVRDIVHLQEVLAWLRGKPEVTGTRTRIILEARSS